MTRCELRAEAAEVEEGAGGEQCRLIGPKVPAVDGPARSGAAVRLVEVRGAGPLERSEEAQVEAGWQEAAAVVEAG